MPSDEFIIGPTDLLIWAFVVGVVGIILLAVANAWEKAMGDNEASRLERMRHHRSLGFFGQLDAFYSDRRNMPVSVGMGGMMMIFGAICMGVAALVWFLIRAL